MCIFDQITKKYCPLHIGHFSLPSNGLVLNQDNQGRWLREFDLPLTSVAASKLRFWPPTQQMVCWPLNFSIKSCGLQTWVFCLKLSEWCVKSSAFNFMPETECTPFAEFEAKNSVERPQLLMWEVTGQSNGNSHIHSWCAFGFRNKIRGRLNTPFA